MNPNDIIVRHATREFLGNEVGQKMPPIKSVYVEKSCQGYCVGNVRGKDRNLIFSESSKTVKDGF